MLHTGKPRLSKSTQSDAWPFAQAVRLGVVITLTLFMALAFAQAAVSQTSRSGDTDANILFEQGKIFHDGTGVSRDLEKARNYYLRAAAGGSDFAKINLGYMAFVGEGTAKDYAASLKWYKQAANSGSADAQRMMAVFYKNGLGVTASPAKADLWTRRAVNGWTLPAAPKTLAPKVMTPKPVAPKTPAPKAVTPKPVVKAPVPKMQSKPIIRQSLPKPALPAQQVQPAKPALIAPAPEVTQAASAPSLVNVPAKPAANPALFNVRPALGGVTIAALIAFVILLKILTMVRRARLDDDCEKFVELFFNRNIQILKNSYNRAGDSRPNQRAISVADINDPWVIAVSLMMIRFAQVQETLTGSRSATSETLIAALRDGPIEARRAALPLIPKIKDIIEKDENLSGVTPPKKRKALLTFNWPRFTKSLPGLAAPAE